MPNDQFFQQRNERIRRQREHRLGSVRTPRNEADFWMEDDGTPNPPPSDSSGVWILDESSEPTDSNETSEAFTTRTVSADLDIESEVRGVERPRGWWRMRNGRFVEIREMSERHIQNCISLLSRNARGRGSSDVYTELNNELQRRRDSEVMRRELDRRNIRDSYARDAIRSRIYAHISDYARRLDIPIATELSQIYSEVVGPTELSDSSYPQIIAELERRIDHLARRIHLQRTATGWQNIPSRFQTTPFPPSPPFPPAMTTTPVTPEPEVIEPAGPRRIKI